MKLLVTGGAGYIGSHFCKVARDAGHSVVVFDDLSTGHKEFVRFGPLVEGDIRDQVQVLAALKKHQVEAVVHFAAKSIVPESVKNPELYFSVNVGGTTTILEAMKQAGLKKMVFSSSAAVYGQPEKMPIAENDPQQPLNPYGQSKLRSEKVAFNFQKQDGFRIAALRYFNVIGCDPDGELWENHNPETHLVPSVIRALNEEREFSVFGRDYPTPDGSAVRDYVDVNDLGRVHLKALAYLDDHSKLVSNVGVGRGHSVLEVFQAVESVFGRAPKLVDKPRRDGDPASLVADATFFNSWYKNSLMTMEESLENLRNRQPGVVR